MTKLDRWTLKIHAFLHDPPHKPLALGRDHAGQGASLAEAITKANVDPPAAKIIETADHLASGADRHNWLKDFDFSVKPRSELQLVHPLEGKPILQPGTVTGRAFELAFPAECVDAVERLGPKLARVLEELPDNRLRFLVMWRFLPELLARLEGQDRNLGLLWPLLPADSRMPDHSVLIHDSLVAALATILQVERKAALLRVQFAPVQDFIEASRKLRDLWASSSILAETTWCGIEPIVQEFGPDHVLFPSLRYEPRFDRWLLEQLRQENILTAKDEKEAGGSLLWEVKREAEEHLERALRTPSLPNVFTAIVPYESAEALAREIETQLREFWARSIEESAAAAGNGEEYGLRGRRQAEALLQVFWSVVPWPLDMSPSDWIGSQNPKLCWHKNEPNLAKTLKTIKQVTAVFKGFEPNAGLLYPDLTDQATLLVEAVKRERIQHSSEENGLKCSCCGEREVLGGNDFWIQRTEGFEKRQDRGQLTEGEQLCGPCTWKRSFELKTMDEEDTSGSGARHPSTGDIAAAQFKLDVIRACIEGNGDLLNKVKEFVQAAQQDQHAELLEKADLNVFCPQAVDLAARRSEWRELCDFAHIDGQWLLDFPREEAPERRPENTLRAARELRQAARKANIDLPRPYLAVVDFDGDGMGKWLSGTHEDFPKLSETLHTNVGDILQTKHPEALTSLRTTPRLITPGFHASLSAAAATFARFAAPMTIEGEDLPGHLIYAGGDDALFVAPVPVAVELALRLRLRFSGWPARFPESLLRGDEQAFSHFTEMLRNHFDTPSAWTVARLGKASGRPEPVDNWQDAERLGLAFGTRATASAGMCVFHYRWPLGSALRMAREALHAAKNATRNALGIVVQRRSGSISQTVVPFALKGRSGGESEGKIYPVVRLLQTTAAFTKLEEKRAVSTRLATAFREEIAALHIAPRAGRLAQPARHASELWKVGEALFRRVLARRELSESKETRKYLEEVVLELGRGVEATCRQNPEQALFAWAEALTVAAFLARPGDRG